MSDERDGTIEMRDAEIQALQLDEMYERCHAAIRTQGLIWQLDRHIAAALRIKAITCADTWALCEAKLALTRCMGER